MIIVSGWFRLPVEKLEAAQDAMAAVVHATRVEDGCLGYSYAIDVMDEGLVRVSEAWRERAALDAHMQAPHMDQWRTEREALGLYDRNIRIYETDEGEPV